VTDEPSADPWRVAEVLAGLEGIPGNRHVREWMRLTWLASPDCRRGSGPQQLKWERQSWPICMLNLSRAVPLLRAKYSARVA
jgi:hypothetical protein